MGYWEDWCSPLQWAQGGAGSAVADGTAGHPKAPCWGEGDTRCLPPRPSQRPEPGLRRNVSSLMKCAGAAFSLGQ